jgi:hypothetical protein
VQVALRIATAAALAWSLSFAAVITRLRLGYALTMGVDTRAAFTFCYATASVLTTWLVLNLALSIFMFARVRYRMALWLAQLAPLALVVFDPWLKDAYYERSLAVLVFCLPVAGRLGSVRPALNVRWAIIGACVPVLVIGLAAAPTRNGFQVLLALVWGMWGAWWTVPVSAVVTMTLRSQLTGAAFSGPAPRPQAGADKSA